MSRLSIVALLCSLMLFAGCGGSGSSTPGNNQIAPAGSANVAAIVAGGVPPTNPAGATNGLFTTVTVCLPNTSNCAQVNGILVDTGSFGLRIISSVLPAGFNLPLQTSGGNTVAECTQFADGFSWGPVATADMTIAGEKATSMPVQLITGSFNGIPIPTSCTSTGPEEDAVTTFGANGVIGVGNFALDCGDGCATSASNGVYFACPASGCVGITQALNAQVVNPVALFSTDNNGVIIELPQISTSGAASANGSMVFGIGTQSNNGLGTATVLDLDQNGNFTTVFQGNSISGSFVDSGSNGLFFADSTLATCNIGTPTNPFTAFCPASTTNLTATNIGANAASINTSFSVTNVTNLAGVVFNDLGAPQPTGITGFDWGLPFFFGRNVFVSIAGTSAPGGTTPYTAY